jgi:hypothetical protein
LELGGLDVILLSLDLIIAQKATQTLINGTFSDGDISALKTLSIPEQDTSGREVEEGKSSGDVDDSL